MELQEITENAIRSMDNLIEQLEDTSSETLPMHELHGLDKQPRSVRGSLKVKCTKKKVELHQCIEQEKCKLEGTQDNPEYDKKTSGIESKGIMTN